MVKDPNSPHEIKTYNGSLLPSGFGTWLLNIAFQRWGNYLCFLLTYSKGDYSFLYEYDSSAVMRLFDISDPLNLKGAGWGTIKAGCSKNDSECCMMDLVNLRCKMAMLIS